MRPATIARGVAGIRLARRLIGGIEPLRPDRRGGTARRPICRAMKSWPNTCATMPGDIMPRAAARSDRASGTAYLTLRFRGARHAGAARRRCLGIPADTGILYCQRCLHDRGKSRRCDPGRRRAAAVDNDVAVAAPRAPGRPHRLTGCFIREDPPIGCAWLRCFFLRRAAAKRFDRPASPRGEHDRSLDPWRTKSSNCCG